MTDAEIVALYRRRDETAIGETEKRYGARLRALAERICADRETAKECENDGYLEAWNRIPPSDPGDYLYPFLARLVRHIALDRCRAEGAAKRKAELVALDEELAACLAAPEDVDSTLDAKALGEAINGFLGTLPREKRVIFLRRYFFLDPTAAIAERCGIGESKVKTTLFRLRNELRIYLMKEGFDL